MQYEIMTKTSFSPAPVWQAGQRAQAEELMRRGGGGSIGGGPTGHADGGSVLGGLGPDLAQQSLARWVFRFFLPSLSRLGPPVCETVNNIAVLNSYVRVFTPVCQSFEMLLALSVVLSSFVKKIVFTSFVF